MEEALHWLPEGETADDQGDLGVDPATPAPAGKRARILLADDNADMRGYVHRLLSAQYEVEAVGDGEQALASIARKVPDLVLTDVMMPRLDGFGLLARLRADPRTSATPVILLSARAGEESRVEGLQAGADDYLIKPFSARELMARVEAHLKLKKLREQLQTATRESEERFRAIVEASTDAIVSKNLDGVITSWNKGAEHIFGYAESEVIGKPVTILIPLDRHDEEPEILQRIRRGERVEHYETVRQRKDGSLLDVSLSISPVKDASGRVIGASKIARDITQRKRAEMQQELLAHEIHHRTKNLFAVVHAVVSRSFAGKQSVEDAQSAVLGRLHALAETHTMLMDKDWQGADLADVVRTEMSPYGGRVTIEGPSLILKAKTAQNFVLAVHELATNAAKYGALSNAAGRVDISWSRSHANGSGVLIFRWQERGGPPVGPPARKGFGSAVLEHVMAEYFDPPPRIDFKTGGVTYELTGPLDALTTDGDQAS